MWRGHHDAFLALTILVSHHRVLGANEVFIVGDALDGERHQGSGIDVEGPRDTAKEEDTIGWVVEGIGVVAGSGAEDAAFAGGVSPESVAADFGVFEGGAEIFGSCWRDGADDLDVLFLHEVPVGFVIELDGIGKAFESRVLGIEVDGMSVIELAPL